MLQFTINTKNLYLIDKDQTGSKQQHFKSIFPQPNCSHLAPQLTFDMCTFHVKSNSEVFPCSKSMTTI